jgi:hypothetical protein
LATQSLRFEKKACHAPKPDAAPLATIANMEGQVVPSFSDAPTRKVAIAESDAGKTVSLNAVRLLKFRLLV